ncbi:MAG: hypothetical protein MJE77_46330 [Proteobacteria bacterium]|nr:hypothetical protein [Pseudomonadota bacterium]
MKNVIAVRREDLSKKGEQRVAIPPNLAGTIAGAGHRLLVQSRAHHETGAIKRAFADALYSETGAEITEDLSGADVVFGLKEIERQHIMPDKAYYFFSHTHKGQKKNRPLLATLVEKNATVVDYELITDDQGRRVVTAFTYFAGYAGMIDSLWTLGRRLASEGIENAFQAIPQSIATGGLDAAKRIVTEVGTTIRERGTPAQLPPVIACFLGEGKTSTGAREIYDLLPVTAVTIDQLADVFENGSRDQVYKLVIDIPEMYRLKADSSHHGKSFSRQDLFQLYFREYGQFETNVDRIFPYCMLLMNCILWAPEYPRLITLDEAKSWYVQHQTLRVVGDITCDPEGALQFSQETWIDDPVFIYNPATGTQTMGIDGDGIAVMAVTNLPCEFPADASSQFGRDISPLVESIISADYRAETVDDSGLDEAVKRATLLWRGKFTPPYQYMAEYI